MRALGRPKTCSVTRHSLQTVFAQWIQGLHAALPAPQRLPRSPVVSDGVKRERLLLLGGKVAPPRFQISPGNGRTSWSNTSTHSRSTFTVLIC